jgi:hypothetical protein
MSQKHYLFSFHRVFLFSFLRKNGNTSNLIHQEFFFRGLERERVGRKMLLFQIPRRRSSLKIALRRSSGTVVVRIRSRSLATLRSTRSRIVVLDSERRRISRCSCVGSSSSSRHSIIRFLLLLHLLLLVRFVLVIGLVQRGHFLLECFDTFL